MKTKTISRVQAFQLCWIFLIPGTISQRILEYENTLDYNVVNQNNPHSPLSPAYWRTTTPGSIRPSGSRATNNAYWPFQRERLNTIGPSTTDAYEPLPLITNRIQASRISDEYSGPRGRSFQFPDNNNANVRMYSYRPTQLDYRLPELNAPRRPVITVAPERQQISYGRPYIRVPYEDNFVPVTQRPIIRAQRPRLPPQDYKVVVPLPEYGPFSKHGQFYRPENQVLTQDLETIVDQYGPFSGQGQKYAPDYGNYIPSLRFKHIQKPRTGEYDVEYLAANGIYRKEQGYLKPAQLYNEKTRSYETRLVNVKSGTVSWTSPEGIPFSYSYIADEKGYRPTPLQQSTTPEAAAAYQNYYKGLKYAPLVPY